MPTDPLKLERRGAGRFFSAGWDLNAAEGEPPGADYGFGGLQALA